MKSLVRFALSALALVILTTPLSVSAESGSTSTETEITGSVYHRGKKSSEDRKITVSCEGHSRTVYTGRSERYSVRFKKSECKKGSWVTVTSEHKGKRGSSHRKHDGRDRCNVDVDDEPPVTDVPELGTVVTAASSIAGGSAFLLIRRRKLNDTRA